MSSESDGEGSPRGWTLLDNHEHAEDSEDSSGCSSDFVDLGADSVRYHPVTRSSSVIDIAPGNSASSSSFSSSSLPANFQAHCGANGSQKDAQNSLSPDGNAAPRDISSSSGISEVAEICNGDGAVRPRTHGNRSLETHLAFQEGSLEENAPGANKQASDLENFASSSVSTLTGSQSPLLASYSNGIASAGDQLGAHSSESLANILTSENLNRVIDADEPDALDEDRAVTGSTLDNISVDSIEVLSMPSKGSNFLEDEAKLIKGLGAGDDQGLDVVPALLSMAAASPETETNPDHLDNKSQKNSGNEESDTSEFERIDPEMIPALDEVDENQTMDAAEEDKMDVAGARPTEELGDEPLSNISFLRLPHQPRNYLEMPPHEPEDLGKSLPPPPVINPNMSASSSRPASLIHPWPGQSSVAGIQPFPFDHLPARDRLDRHHRAASSSESSSGGLHQLHQPPGRFGLPRQHSYSSSDEGFELLQRLRGRDDDEVSSVSSSSSDLSGFVNVRQRRGPPLSPSISEHHSDFDDYMLDSFTDISEDCLPANMMIQRQKSGVRQYRHRRDDGLNTRLDWLVAMVLLAGLALGIGHFIGSSQEMAHQHSVNTGQVQRLRELQDDLVTCLDRSTGIDGRITTEETSPALQAVKLLEGLNSKMMAEEGLYTSRLLEEKVGGEEELEETGGGRLNPTDEKMGKGDEVLIDSGVGDEKASDDKDAKETHLSSEVHSTDGNLEDGKETADVLGPENLQRVDDNTGLGFNETAVSDERSSSHHRIIMSSDEKLKSLVDDPVALVESKTLALNSVGDGEAKELEEAAKETQVDASIEGEKLENQLLPAKDSDGQFVRDIIRGTENRPRSFEYFESKIESLEEKMKELVQTTQNWQKMFEESKNEESTEEAESQKDKESFGNDQGNRYNTENDDDPLAGIGATFQSLWSEWLGTDHGKVILHYLNQTQAQSALWSEAFIRKLDSMKALPDSEQVQAILNNTKLLATHLGKEIQSVSGYLRNQSAKLAVENNITAKNIGEKASNAWINLKNATSDVLDYNKQVLSMFGEQVVDALHSVENISAKFIAKQNLSMFSVTNLAEQTWGSVKNYSSIVTETILNKTSETRKTTPQSESVDDPEPEPNAKTQGGFGEKLRGAWDIVSNYSSNLTSKQNLSISGLREKVKAAWNKVKNTSSQVMEDISESSLAEKLKGGAKQLGEKVGTTIMSVKEQIKGWQSRKGRCGKKKHRHDNPERHYQADGGKKKKYKKHKDRKWHEKHDDREDNSSGSSEEEKEGNHEQRNKQHGTHQRHTNDNRHCFSKDHIRPGKRGQIYHKKQYSVPSRSHNQHQQHDDKFEAGNIYSTSDPYQWDPPHGDAGSVEDGNWKRGTTHLKQEPSLKQDQQKSLPLRQQMGTIDVKNQERVYGSGQKGLKDEKMTSKEPPPKPGGLGSSGDGASDTVSNWEELFDFVDMHCKGNEKCMHSQRRDAARLYSELLDYQEWLKERNLRKDVRELKEFLEELGEFLSETDSDDKDLDELKDEFGEMVQDMEEGALKRQRKQEKYRDRNPNPANQNHAMHQPEDIVDDPDEVENSTVVIDFQTLPQKQDSGYDSQSHHDAENTEKRKYAGRGFHSNSDDNDWYLQRAKVRAEQRKTHQWIGGDKSHRDTPNWYLHWVQGRINGRTGVTVWDMYEWIKERYMLREELRRHDMEDHTNWFLKRP